VDLRSWLEVSSEKLAHNLRTVRDAAPEAEVLAVIKADAYGHGARVVGPMLSDEGVRWLGVNDVDDAVVARASLQGREAQLLLMCGARADQAAHVMELDATPVVWEAEQVNALHEAARIAGKRVRVHVEVETGMARQGAAVGSELAALLRALAASGHVRCEGVFTHLCCSEVAGAQTTQKAMRAFEQALEQVHAVGILPHYLHVANTSAIDEQTVTPWLQALAKLDSATVMVRPGLALYGYALPVEGGSGVFGGQLQPVMRWKTRVVALREIAKDQTVGYGATFMAPQTMRLALLQVGYADGLTRAASSGLGNGWVIVRGMRARVIGRVSMNMTVVDVTEIVDISVGDEVTLLGEGVSAEDHAQWAGTIVYHVLCGMRASSSGAL
jgi:alanine racemase